MTQDKNTASNNGVNVLFQTKEVMCSKKNGFFLDTPSANVVFSGKEKDLLVTFNYDIERKEKEKANRIVLSANVYETDEYHQKGTGILARIHKLMSSGRELHATDVFAITDYERFADGSIRESIDEDVSADEFNKRSFVADLSQAKFESNNDKINKIIAIAQKQAIKAWNIRQKEIEAKEKQEAKDKKSADEKIGAALFDKYLSQYEQDN